MAIKQLTDEQVRTWSLKKKDEWWFKEVYQGNVPQFTLRAVITGTTISCREMPPWWSMQFELAFSERLLPKGATPAPGSGQNLPDR